MCDSQAKEDLAEKELLVVLWRRVACAAVMLLYLRCSHACIHHRTFKGSKQVSQLKTYRVECFTI